MLELAEVALKSIAGTVAKHVTTAALSHEGSHGGLGTDVEDCISAHLRYVSNWTLTHGFLGLTPKTLQGAQTISLRLSKLPRRFQDRDSKQSGVTHGEDELLRTLDHLILLGDPGGGKTTTLKRLAYHLLAHEPTQGELHYQVPLVIVLREMKLGDSIFDRLATFFGVTVDQDTENIQQTRQKISGHDAEIVLSKILDSMMAVLIVDGLDEVSNESRRGYEADIERLSGYCQQSKIIVSCRSGDYTRSLSGFKVLELAPLNTEEILAMSALWTSDVNRFLAEIKSKPYFDLVDRPLILSFLAFLFENEGDVPPIPSQIYRKVIYRILKEWDDERGIDRSTKYTNFDPDTKIDFLSEFSYRLTYKIESRSFREDQALEIIADMAVAYELANNQFSEIIREIETHTGIIIAAGFDRFEFAHLSIQEYLCANYISRSPFPDLLEEYLAANPAPVSVACAISSQPDRFIFEMIKKHLVKKFQNPEDFFHSVNEERQLALDLFGTDTSKNLQSFVRRLSVEKPRFRGSKELGEAVAFLFCFYYRRYSNEVDSSLIEWIETPAVSAALKNFINEDHSNKFFRISSKTCISDFTDRFVEIYEAVAGPWPKESDKSNILPPLLLPESFVKDIANARTFAVASEKEANFLRARLSGTPFCKLESGRHNFKEGEGRCAVCGAGKNRRISNPGGRPKRKTRSSKSGKAL